jgi:predicted transcriptional regulator
MPAKYSHYRSKTDIVARILQAANESNGITQTKIMYRGFLSYVQLREYLVMLVENGLLEYFEGTRTYRTTEKGLKFLNMYEKMEELAPGTKLLEGQNNK